MQRSGHWISFLYSIANRRLASRDTVILEGKILQACMHSGRGRFEGIVRMITLGIRNIVHGVLAKTPVMIAKMHVYDSSGEVISRSKIDSHG